VLDIPAHKKHWALRTETVLGGQRKRERRPMCLAIPGQVVEVVDDGNRLAQVDVAGVKRTVNIGLLDEEDGGAAQPGDWVLIHVGFALSKVDEEEALATLRLLEGMGEDYEQELEELRASAIE
jgi:hydrogenase expression/formation protein HypC